MLGLSPVKQRLFHNNGNSGSSILSVRRLSWLLTGITALTFVCGFWIMTLWLPAQYPPLPATSSSTTMESSNTPFRQLRHDGDNDENNNNNNNNNNKLVRRPFGSTVKVERQHSIQPIASGQDSLVEHDILEFLQDADDALQQEQPVKQPSPKIQQLQDDWELPLVHIVNTRFMQEQGHLQALGRARLYLFQTFCLPTMLQQSTQQFLWIIKTDPNLDSVLLTELMETLRPYPNIYLVASNVNFMIRQDYSELEEQDPNEEESTPKATTPHHAHHRAHHSWRDGAEIRDILSDRVYTGNMTKLYQAMVQKDLQVVLETRLDADDGLHKFYLQQVQDKALDQFFLPPSDDEEETQNNNNNNNNNKEDASKAIVPKWLYWCTRRHVEWHGGVTEHFPPPLLPGKQGTTDATKDNPNMAAAAQKTVDYFGSLKVIEHSKLCITPGITVGFGIGTTSDEVPIHAHDKLFRAIHDLEAEEACGYDEASQCLELVEDFLLVAVRARTPTSAGMQRVEGTSGSDDSENAVNNHNDKSSNGGTNTTKHKHKKRKHSDASALRTFLFWDLLHDDFAVKREQIKYTNQFILNHLVPIAKDNLEGQCTSDHSCKVCTMNSFCA